MSEKLKNPPVVEVLFHIGVEPISGFNPEIFKDSIEKRFPGRFANAIKLKAVHMNFSDGPEGSPVHNTNVGFTGYRFVTEDKKFMAHYQSGGLTLNFLPEYVGFETALGLLKEHWEFYKGIAGHRAVSLALRYIDKIVIESPDARVISMNEYFNLLLPIPNGMEAVGGMMVSQVKYPDDDAQVQVTWQPSGEAKTGRFEFMLDTNAFVSVAGEPDEGVYWAKFGALRALCQTVFKSTLTEKCLDLFR